jgi:hypothetical protein
MKTPHIHADVIKAWADGAEIEVSHNTTSNGWLPADAPNWSLSCSYRVKPKPKPNTVHHLFVTYEDGRNTLFVFGTATSSEHPCDNLRLTFDGETNKLIKSEILI